MASPLKFSAGGISLEKLTPTIKGAITAICVIFVATVYFVVFYNEVQKSITTERKKEETLLLDLEKANRAREEYQRDLDEKTRRETAARDFKKVLPDDSEMPVFLSSLQGVASVSGVNLTSWNPSEEIPGEYYAKIPMRLTLSGTYHQLAKFFYGIGKLDRIINIEEIKIDRVKQAKGEVPEDDIPLNAECLATAFRSLRSGEVVTGAVGRNRGGGNK